MDLWILLLEVVTKKKLEHHRIHPVDDEYIVENSSLLSLSSKPDFSLVFIQ